MAVMEGYLNVLDDACHTVRLVIFDGKEMQIIRLKVVSHIQDHTINTLSIRPDAVFNPYVVGVGDIFDYSSYYGGSVFCSSNSPIMCEE